MEVRYANLLALPVLLLLACGKPLENSRNKFSDPIILKIADFKDRRAADSLYPFFHHENALYRREAVEAFGSIQETDNIDRIGRLLMMDPDADVRRSAAFALGQIAGPACERLLLGALIKEKAPENIATILDAYGKTTGKWSLQPQSFLADSLTTEGLAWSLYRAALRGKTDSAANGVAKKLLDTTYSTSTRLAAAHYFARGAQNSTDAFDVIANAATGDPLPEVRMAATLALGKVTTDASLQTINAILTNESDYRVIVNAVRALRSFPFGKVSQTLFKCLRHNNTHVAIAASEVIRDRVTKDHWISVSAEIGRATQEQVIANLYEGILRASGREDIAKEIEQRYRSAGDARVKAAFLASLQHHPPSFRFIVDELNRADTAIIRSTAAATLAGMNYSPNFNPKYRRTFAGLYRDILLSTNDFAVIGSIASVLADSTLGYRDLIRDYSFLNTARTKLRLPEHFEAIQPLESAIACFERKKPPVVKNDFNHPIDWTLVRSIPEDLQVTIKTTRGDVVVRLFVNDAPGSVANFLTLARNDYFDNKYFHRVVPNFVVQTGCSRGDSWGSEPYSLRSEFCMKRYGAGTLGVASAGKDTEGTQWFITHSPTPHLDGRYTIFGQVVEGMDAVDYLQENDRIIDVSVPDFTDR